MEDLSKSQVSRISAMADAKMKPKHVKAAKDDAEVFLALIKATHTTSYEDLTKKQKGMIEQEVQRRHFFENNPIKGRARRKLFFRMMQNRANMKIEETNE